MKFKNNGADRHVFGIHFHGGSVVELRDDLPQDKVDYLMRNFELIEDKPKPEPPEPQTTASKPRPRRRRSVVWRDDQ